MKNFQKKSKGSKIINKIPLETFIQRPDEKEWTPTGYVAPGRGELIEDNRAPDQRDLIVLKCEGSVSIVERLIKGNSVREPLKRLTDGESFEFQVETDNAGPLKLRVVHVDSPQ